MVARSRQHIGRGRALRRALPAVLAALASLVVPAAAGAHAVVQPGASRPADLQRYTVTIPNEGNSATTEVALKVPAGIDFLLAEKQPGWKVSNQSKALRWSGGSIPPRFYQAFHFIARNPVRTGPIDWKIVQTYADGHVQRWIGPPDSDEPAAVTDIRENAPAQDVVAVNGGEASQQNAAPASGATSASNEEEDGDGTDWIPITLGAVALAVSVFALIAARRRPA